MLSMCSLFIAELGKRRIFELSIALVLQSLFNFMVVVMGFVGYVVMG